MTQAALERLKVLWVEAEKAMILANYSIGGTHPKRKMAQHLLDKYFRTLENELEITDRTFEET